MADQRGFPQGFYWEAPRRPTSSRAPGTRTDADPPWTTTSRASTRDTPRTIRWTSRPDLLYPNHDGIDFYHRYERDIELFAEMGFNIAPHVHQLEPHLPQR